MTFLNGALLFGAFAAAIPVILHILNRSKFRRVEWGAMHLLESVIKVNHKRFRFEQWLLLLVRCAIPALLALCLARPVLTGSQMLAGNSPVSLVVLLDTSYSMDATANGMSRFQQAVDAAIDIVENASNGSEVSVIQTGGSPTPIFDQPVYDAEAIVRQLKTLQGGYGASEIRQSLDEGLATLAGMSHPRRELVVISDFQPADWNNSDNIAASIHQQVDAAAIKPALSLLKVGENVTGNVSVESLEFSKRPLGVRQPLLVRANLKNHGNVAADNARVILNVDGAEYSVSQVSLAANGATQALFPVAFETPGSRVMEVEVAVDDSLPTDNTIAAAVTIWDQINVLLVDGDPSSQPLKGETDFLSVALTPYSFGREMLSDLVRTTTTRVDKLNADLLNDTRVIVLANVPRLKDDQLSSLKNFVGDGGSLLVCPGNRVDASWYNEKLVVECGLLPAEFGVPRGRINDEGQSSRVVAQHFDHPALQFFNEPANGDLSTAEIRQWYELRLRSSTSLSRAVPTANLPVRVAALRTARLGKIEQRPVILARLDNGDPFLVEHTFGDGVVMQLATSCDADWSDLPMRPFYVPLMQQLVTTMATQLTPPRNIRTGEPAVVLLHDTRSSHPEGTEDIQRTDERGLAQESPPSLTITTPDGTRRTVQASPQGNRTVARFEGTRRPGVYTFSGADAATIHIVATTSREESQLGMLDEPQLASLAEGMGASVVSTTDQYVEADRLRRHGTDIWKYVLITLLAFMFLELFLQQRFSKVRV